jgi:hypothetical protein
MGAVALLSFDFFTVTLKASSSSISESSSSFHRKREMLIKVHQLLLDNYYHNFTSAVFTNEELLQMILYFECLSFLPENIKDLLLRDRPIPALALSLSPPLMDMERGMVFSQVLKEELEQTSKVMNKSLAIVTNFPVLKSGLFPVDIAIVEKEAEEESGKNQSFQKVLAFMDVNNEDNQENDKSVSRTLQLKEMLYGHYYPKVSYQSVNIVGNEDETIMRKTIRKVLKKLTK